MSAPTTKGITVMFSPKLSGRKAAKLHVEPGQFRVQVGRPPGLEDPNPVARFESAGTRHVFKPRRKILLHQFPGAQRGDGISGAVEFKIAPVSVAIGDDYVRAAEIIREGQTALIILEDETATGDVCRI